MSDAAPPITCAELRKFAADYWTAICSTKFSGLLENDHFHRDAYDKLRDAADRLEALELLRDQFTALLARAETRTKRLDVAFGHLIKLLSKSK